MTSPPVKAMKSSTFLPSSLCLFTSGMDAVDSLYFLEPNDWILSRSNVSVTYCDNHRGVKSIGPEFEDNRIKTIGAIGGIITAVVSMALEAPPEKERLKLPLVLDLTAPATFATRGTYADWQNIPNYKQWWYR